MTVDVAGRVAPDKRNYKLGKGHVLFKPEGEDSYFHLGNAPSCVLTPTVETVDHFSSMTEERTLDDTIVTSKAGEITITLEEATANNLRLMLLGTLDEDAYGDIVIDLFTQTSITGAFLFVATNAKGPRWRAALPKVTMIPTGGVEMISEEVGQMELTGKWESDDGDFGTFTLKPARGTAAPENVLLPFIATDSGTTIREGDELEAFVGAWVDASEFAYQWKADGVNITDATEKTYTLTNAEVGSDITVQVTASNSFGFGSTIATSAEVGPVENP